MTANAHHRSTRLVLVLACVLGAAIEAAPREVQQLVEPAKVKVGEPFTYRIVLSHAREERFELMPLSSWGDFELLLQDRKRLDAGDGSTTTFTLKLALFALGEHRIPELTFEIIGPQGSVRWVLPEKTVEAVSSLPPEAGKDGAELHDIKPPRDLPIRSLRVLWVASGLLLAALIAWVLIREMKKLRARRAQVIEPPLPEHVRALRALDALVAERLPERGQAHAYYFRLSEIVRQYIAERYRVEALESTTSELRLGLRKSSMPSTELEGLIRFLEEGDLVKFARVLPDASGCDASMAYARQLIQRTQAPTQVSQPHAAPRV